MYAPGLSFYYYWQWKNFYDRLNRFGTIPRRDGRTDGQQIPLVHVCAASRLKIFCFAVLVEWYHQIVLTMSFKLVIFFTFILSKYVLKRQIDRVQLEHLIRFQQLISDASASRVLLRSVRNCNYAEILKSSAELDTGSRPDRNITGST